MHTTISKRLVLFLAATTALYVGGNLMYSPDALYQGFEITLPSGAGIRSDLRGVGTLILVSGVYLLLGCLQQRLQRSAAHLGILLYGSFLAGRLLSLILDGVPSNPILFALGAEAVILYLLLASLRPWDRQTDVNAITVPK
ncbi:DUF4345 domain-containing protein [Gilvimarinus sp. SDUM040013]|uniref:DUF4345 domain-containing protein n=1 Tax=Gilvimarinus gilvus TaxID=3058038 RepID=A0ABU4RX09_9GAMM|nr:DUF4345 domain-containing protein [Gilvimarinus sp. SDUM040013]MDO3387933.1 DUF4345 domain-containing protein [Gilvimarinus sp. SDUM040013]MDX6848696.1 DUF4345 domain-containing protein [Gilvimarinus sp. SDUM040013]